MSNILLSALINHILTVVENTLISDEPQIVASIETELKLLVTKIENLLASKSPNVASIVNPVLENADTLANTAVSTLGNVLASTPSN